MNNKYADFKLAAFLGENPSGKTKSLLILGKKKNGLFFINADRNFPGDIGAAFTFFLGGLHTIATLKDGYVELSIPEKEELIKVDLIEEEQLDPFMLTDYHGYAI